MATSTKHSGFKRLLDRNQTLAILVNGAEALSFRRDSTKNYGVMNVGTPYEAVASIIDGYGVSLATGHTATGSNRTFALGINADTGSTDLTGDTYEAAIRGRTVIGTTQTNASIMGVIGCIDVGSAKNIQGNFFGLDGVLDFYANSTAGSGASFFAGAGRFTVWNEGTTTVGVNGVLCGIDICQNSGIPTLGAGALNPAIHIRSQAAKQWAVGIYMNAAGVTKGIQIGTLSSTTAGSGVKLDATTTRVVEVHGDDADTARAVGTQGRAIFGRVMIYKDNACEDWGIHGLSKVSAVAKTGNVSAGVVGAFESTGTCSTATGSGNTLVAGVMGRLGGGGTFTIGAGTYACGVLSFYNTSTASAFTNTGTCAFMATASDIAGTGDWDYGLYHKVGTVSFDIKVQAEDVNSLPCIITSGAATNDAGIVTAIGADTLWADGSLYISVVDGAGKLFQKQADTWVDMQAA